MDAGALRRAIVPRLAARIAPQDLRRFLKDALPRLGREDDPVRWLEQAEILRGRLLGLLFRGHPEGLLDAAYPVEWAEVLEPDSAYRIRKLRYEGYPGIWVPALLYEPTVLGAKTGTSIRVPAVLNPDGHHAGGKAMAYKQARCINLAKRGMLALNFEFIGMGQLSASRRHDRIAHLDLVGIEGTGIFYLIMKRALDVLLAHPNADHGRVAMTGFSGGGWQTIILSSLDARITAPIPVAGHTAAWQRMRYPADIGDMEQLPADLCTVADYDTLSAMLAPRPTLFIYNSRDDCCFATERARVSVIAPARRYFALLDAADKMETHDNTDPGTHNYEKDNREKLYSFLNRRFGLSTPETDLPWKNELRTEEALSVALPADNETILSLAMKKARELAAHDRPEAAGRRGQTGDEARARDELRVILRLPRYAAGPVRDLGSETVDGIAVSRFALRVGGAWTIPAVMLQPPVGGAAAGAVPVIQKETASGGAPVVPEGAAACGAPVVPEGAAAERFTGGEIALAVHDEGRMAALDCVMTRCRCAADGTETRRGPAPDRVLVADIFGTGELKPYWKKHMLLNAAGVRPLGIQVAQILALAAWLRETSGGRPVSLQAGGLAMSVAALVAVALEPPLFGDLLTDSLPDTLGRLIDWPVDYESAPSLFCFGLLERFDVSDLIRLRGTVRVRDLYRGPLP
jgi:dienelactone hydrolase